jgi:Ras-related protein Rab-1A
MASLQRVSNTDKYDYLFKFVLIGDSGVGKTSTMVRFFDDTFDSRIPSSMGVDFRYCTLMSQRPITKICKVQVWDTAGQEKFRAISAQYYRGAHGVILVFDITNRDTFAHIPDWVDQVRKYNKMNATILLVGNKCDLKSFRQVSEEEAKKLAADLELTYIETSAKDAHNIEHAFATLLEQSVASVSAGTLQTKPANELEASIIPGQSKPINQGGYCCSYV